MKPIPPLALAMLLLCGTGCLHTGKPTAGSSVSGAPEATADARDVSLRALEPSAVRVFVDGRDRGGVPKTLRIRRSFGDMGVSVRRGKEILRVFEIEIVYSSNTSDLLWHAGGFGGQTQFDLTDLEQRRNGAYIVPYFPYAIQIEDRELGLTLLVEE